MSEVKATEIPVAPVDAPMVEETTVAAPVETAPAAVETVAPITTTTTDEVTPVTAETTAPEVSAAEETKEVPTVPEIISEGYLEFKPHGLLHFMSTKRYFFVQDEPVTAESLTGYLKKEKPEVAHPTAAHASQTGKGLLFFSKSEALKATPVGIINLADVVDVTTSGISKFALKLSHDVWNFEAHNAVERDSWVHSIKAKVEEAKEGAETITTSEGYKAALEKLKAKPTPVVAAKSPETREEVEGKEEIVEESAVKKEKKKEKKDDDSSSSSSSEDEGPSDKKKKEKAKKNNRTSKFFGGILPGKKDKEDKKAEKIEEQKEDKIEEEAVVAAPATTTAPVIEEPVVETAAPVEPAAEVTPVVVAPVVLNEVKPIEETPTAVEEAPKSAVSPSEEVTTPKGGKRLSFFGFLDKKKAVTPVEENKEVAPISDTAPVIAPIGEEQKPLEAAPVEEAKPVEETAAVATPVAATTPATHPKESFLDKFFKPKDRTPAATAVVAADGPKKEEIIEAARTEEVEPVKETEEKPVEATAATSPKDAKRRSSFFNLNLGKKKEKEVKSDTEEETPAKSHPTSPLPKMASLFRKNSKSAKDAPKVEDKEEVPPIPAVAPEVSATETPVAAVDAPVSETPAPVAEVSEPAAPEPKAAVPATA